MRPLITLKHNKMTILTPWFLKFLTRNQRLMIDLQASSQGNPLIIKTRLSYKMSYLRLWSKHPKKSWNLVKRRLKPSLIKLSRTSTRMNWAEAYWGCKIPILQIALQARKLSIQSLRAEDMKKINVITIPIQQEMVKLRLRSTQIGKLARPKRF